MISLFACFSFCDSLVLNALKHIDSYWEGNVSYCSQESKIFSPLSLNCSFSKDQMKTNCLLTNLTDGTEDNYIIKQNDDIETELEIHTQTGEQISNLKIHETKKHFLANGLLDDDQIVISIDETHLTISITDKISSKTILMSFKRKNDGGGHFEVIAKVVITFIFAIFFLVFIYKKSDMSDVIKPEEGLEALRIKRMAIAAEQRKKARSKEKKD